MSDDKRYGFVDLMHDGSYSSVRLFTSEPALIIWSEAEIKRVFPHCRITVTKDLLGEADSIMFDTKRGDSSALFRYLRRQMCHQGWEPYSSEGTDIHRFRRRINP